MWPWGGNSSEVDIGDNVPNSLMLDSTLSQYLTLAAGAASPTTYIFTFNFKVKLGKIDSNNRLLAYGIYDLNNYQYISISAGQVHVACVFAGVAYAVTSSCVLRDPNAWYDITVGFDTTQAVATNRITMEVNMVQVPYTGTPMPQNSNMNLGARQSLNYLGQSYTGSSVNGFDGYLAKVNYVNASKLSASNFNRTSVDTGACVNKDYTGTYNSASYKLEFLNGASLGTDTSGNGNNWTLNGGIVAANQTTDTPTNNFAVLNPIAANGGGTFSRGNLTYLNANADWRTAQASIVMTSGKWFAQATMGQASATWYISLGLMSPTGNFAAGQNPGSVYWGASMNNALIQTYAAGVAGASAGGSFTTSTILKCAVDIDAGKLWLGYDAVWFGGGDPATGTLPTYTFTAGTPLSFAGAAWVNAIIMNFNATPPTGFKALCTANLPQPSNTKPSAHIAHRWEAGSGIAANIATDRASWTDWIEIFKRTDSTEDWKLRFSSDTGNMIACNTNAAKTAWVAPSAGTYLGLALKVGVAYGIATGTYAGNSAASQDVAHGLGVAAKFALIKDEATGSVYIWHTSMTGATYFTIMDSATPPAQSLTNTPFGGSGWTSTTFGVTNNATNNLNATGHTYRYILFASVEGFLQALGHTGNASTDGTFEYAGGRPQVQIEKNLSVATDFYLFSDLIDPYNVTASTLSMNTTAAKAAATGVDIVSNGIKHRSTTIANAANAYMDVSILRNSIKYSNAR